MIVPHGKTALVTGGSRGIGRAVAAAADEIVAEVGKAFGRLDIFVANAGVWPPEEVPMARLPLARWRATLAANLDGVFHSARAALGLMGRGGRIVLVSSIAGQRGEAGHADYAASKGALIALTRSRRREVADREHDPARADPHRRADRGTHRVPLQRSCEPCDR